MSDLSNKTAAQLKELLEERQLSKSGNKTELIQRLKTYFDEHPEDEYLNNETDRSNNGGGDNNGVNQGGDGNGNENASVGQQQNRRSVFSFKDIEESLEKFDGDQDKNVDEWIEDFEEQAEVFGWNELEKLVYARRLLKSSAKMYVNSELKPKTWIQFKQGLCKEFEVKVNSALIHEKLSEVKKKKDESFREFCYRVIDMAAPAKFETAAIIRYIVNGIQDSAANKMFLYSAKTISELKEKVRVYEEATKKDVKDKSTTKEKDKEIEKQNDRKSAKSGKNRRCFNCGSDQHESSLCPDKDKGPKCFACGSFGHKSINCVEKKENKPKKEEKVATNVMIVPDRSRSKWKESDCFVRHRQ